jgi:signal transduction histidine kinase
MEHDAPPALRERLAKARGVKESVIVEIRRIVSALGPQALERLGLSAALRRLGARFGKMHPAAIRMRLPRRLPALPAGAQEAVYRVSQNAS